MCSIFCSTQSAYLRASSITRHWIQNRMLTWDTSHDDRLQLWYEWILDMIMITNSIDHTNKSSSITRWTWFSSPQLLNWTCYLLTIDIEWTNTAELVFDLYYLPILIKVRRQILSYQIYLWHSARVRRNIDLIVSTNFQHTGEHCIYALNISM